MKKIAVVTGGAGFIGSHLVDLLLKKNFEVRVLDNLSGGRIQNLSKHKKNKNLKFKKIDINKMSIKEKFFKNAQYIFHLAGKGDIVPSIENPLSYMMTNIIGTTKVLENCRGKKLKSLFMQLPSCCGLAKTPTSESHKISTKYPYALSKYLGETTCFHWSDVYSIPVISIRDLQCIWKQSKNNRSLWCSFRCFFETEIKR